MRYYLLLLGFIIILAGFLRIYNIDRNPPSLNWDEVAFGYNAYSILQTGKDEYGEALPLYLRSLDDYKRPVYSYLTVVSVALFGLNDFAIRFPSAFFGTLTILLVYFLVKELFQDSQTAQKKEKNSISPLLDNLGFRKDVITEYVALLSCFLLAILPWHIQYSRAAFEANVGFFFTGFGILAFLYAFRKNIIWLPVSVVAFGLSQYCYLGQRAVVPLLVLTLIALFRREIVTTLKSKVSFTRLILGLSCVLVLVFSLSLYMDIRRPEGNLRYKATNIFDHSQDMYERVEKEIALDGLLKINLIRRLYHNNYTTGIELVSEAYLSHFSLNYLFLNKSDFVHHPTRGGLLYFWMLPFFLFGIYCLVQWKNLTTKLILFIWFLGAPVASALTYQVPHALRAGEMIIPITIITSLGVTTLFLYIYKLSRKLFVASVVLLTVIILLFSGYFFHEYVIHIPHDYSHEWVYGRKEIVEFTEKNKGKYEKVITSTSLEFPYIFFLYYSKYNPALYLSHGGTKSGGWDEQGNAFDKYEFHRFHYDTDRTNGNFLFIGKPNEFPQDVKPVHIIYNLDGKEAFYIVQS